MRLTWFAAAAAFAMLPAHSNAQDAPLQAQDSADAWAGFYVGGSLGSVAVESQIGEDLIGPPATPQTRSDIGGDGWSLGLFGGYNWQFANTIVLGGEVDLTQVDASTSNQPLFNVNPPSAIPIPNNFFGSDLQWMATVRGRAGYAFGNWMPYVTAGWAFANFETMSDYSGLAPYTRDDTWTAPVYGVGLDYLARGKWSVRGEYRWADFDSESDEFDGFPAFEVRDLNIEEFRLSVAYNY